MTNSPECGIITLVWHHFPVSRSGTGTRKGFNMKAKKLPSGSYRVQVVNGVDANGKRIVKSFTADTEWEAIKMAEEFKQTREDTRVRNLTVAQAMEGYIECRANVIEPTTVRNYHQIAAHCFKCIHNMKLTSLRTIDVQRAVNAESKRVSPKYVKNAYGFLKSVLKMYEVDIKLNNIQLPKLEPKEKNLPDFDTIFNLVHGTEIEIPVLLSVWLSLRIGEVAGIQFRDIDFENHTIKIRRTIVTTEKKKHQVRDRCKTRESTRGLELPEYLLQLISAVPHQNDTDFLMKLTRKAVYSRFKRKVAKIGYEDMTFHDLRSMNASIMLMLGVPDKYAMERGGWSTDHILKSVYQRTFSDERKRVDAKIDNYFNEIIRKNQSA